MSYVKKDEDADPVMIRLDRTSVFQDGELIVFLGMCVCCLLTGQSCVSLQHDCSIPLPSRREYVALS